jgi:hypothetical protein
VRSTGPPRPLTRPVRLLDAADRRLIATPRWVQVVVTALTLLVMGLQSLPNVPREYVDFSRTPLGNVQRYETYGPDSLADRYAARVILNDPWDMYTRARTPQTPLEAATWSREASAPYPPVLLLVEAGLYALGDWSGIGFYGMILGSACLFLALSALYFLKTRWYLFPLLYLNFDYFSERFVYVQDSSYLVMLVVLIGALYLARAGHPACHAAVAVATTMKLSPFYYVKNVAWMSRPQAAVFVAILVTGLVLPYFIWDNYLYIYRYGSELKGDWQSAVGALLLAVPFALVVWYVEVRRGFDLEDRVGWGLVPFALLLAFKMNVARHLLIVLLLPDKRGVRNIAAAVGLAVPALLPGIVAFNSSLAIATVVLVLGLAHHLQQIGMDVVRDDLANPARTLRMLWAPTDWSLARRTSAGAR